MDHLKMKGDKGDSGALPDIYIAALSLVCRQAEMALEYFFLITMKVISPI